MTNTENMLAILKKVVAIAVNRMPKEPTLTEIEIMNEANRAISEADGDVMKYEYAVQEKFKGEWLVDLNGFSSLDEAEDYMNMMCEMNPGYEFRVVRRKTTDWEVVE